MRATQEHITMSKLSRILAATLLAALAPLATTSHAAMVYAIDAGAQQLNAEVIGDLVAVDLRLNTLGSATLELQLDAADIGQTLRLNAVITNATGTDLQGLSVALRQGVFALVGSVRPSFGSVADITGDDFQQQITLQPGEPFGLDLGAPFAVPGTVDWLLAPSGARAGDRLTLVLSAVPEPGTLLNVFAALAAMGLLRRRRR